MAGDLVPGVASRLCATDPYWKRDAHELMLAPGAEKAMFRRLNLRHDARLEMSTSGCTPKVQLTVSSSFPWPSHC